MSVEIVRRLELIQWKSFVDSHPQGNIFHTPEMFQVFARTPRHQSTLWAAVNGDNIPLALLSPVQIAFTDGPLCRFTTRAVAYGSVLCAPGREGKEALIKLLSAYKEEVRGKALFTELRNLSSIESIQPILQKQGFKYEDHLNYLINLNRSSEDIFQSIGRRTRKNIRRGLRKREVIVEEARDKKQVAECYALLRDTYREARIPLSPFSLFENAFELLCPKGMARFSLAYIGETPVATSVELLYKNVIYGWYGGVDRTYSSYVPNELLMWDILKWGAEKGYHMYDFGGAGRPEEDYGVREFKAKFGGEMVCFGRNTCVHSPFLFPLSKLGYRVYRLFF